MNKIKLEVLRQQLKVNNFQILAENVDKLTEEEFTTIRMNTLGASDSSKLLNVNPFPNGSREDLIWEKVSGEYDNSIGEKASVRTGKALEPVILDWLNSLKVFKKPVYKPTDMYYNPQNGLSVNFDGVTEYDGRFIPVEIKVVTRYGRRYYDFNKARYRTKLKELIQLNPVIESVDSLDIDAYCIDNAKENGIPVYYYTQLQQQILALDAIKGYLVILDMEEWELVIFKVCPSKRIITALQNIAIITMAKITYKKGELANEPNKK